MNKKFSTLVAALLVSGASFAMVSAFDVQPLTASPIAKAATANLRATGSASEATAALDFAAFDATTSTKWTVATVTGGFTLKSGNFYLTENATSKSASDAAIFTIKNYRLQINGKDYMNGGDALAAFASTTSYAPLASVTGNNEIYVATATDPNKFLSGTSAYFTGTAVVAPTVSAATQHASGLGSSTKFSLVVDGSKHYLKYTSTTTGLEYYAKMNDDKNGIEFTADKSLAGDVALDTNNSDVVCFVDGGTKYYITINSTTLAVSTSETDAAKLWTAASTPKNDLTTAEVYVSSSGTDGGYGIVVTDGTAASATKGTSVLVTGTQNVWKVKAVEGGFKLYLNTDEVSGYLKEVNGTIIPSAIEADGLLFTQDADGKLRQGTKYVVISTSNIALSDNEEGVTALTLYGIDASSLATAATVADGGLYMLGQVVVPGNMDQSGKTLNIGAITSATLVNNENYMIKGADGKALAMQLDAADGKTYVLGATDKFAASEIELRAFNPNTLVIENVLWTATKTTVAGEAVYSFTNAATGKKLAFKENSSKNGVEFDPTGTYNTFILDGESLTFKYKNATYYVNPTDGTATTTSATITFAQPSESSTPTTAADVKKAVEKLNVEYGAGNGFGLLFKDKALSADGVKDVALEANPFTDADLITAVQGPATSVTGSADLSAKMFLKVSGSYPLKNATAEKQLEAFRTSTFIAIDTVRYSSLVPDYSDNNFFKYTTVKGSSMLSKKGYIYDGTTAADNAAFKKDGNFEGITRRIQNAEFSFSQVAGSTMKDPAYFYVATAYIPAADNGAGLAGHTSAVNNQYINIKKFNNKYYVGAGEVATRWDYVYVGLNNDVTYQQVNGIVNIVSRNYTTNGQIYANQNNSEIGLVLPKYVCTDKPEGQFLVTGGVDGSLFTFTNRESGKKLEASNGQTSFALKTVPGKEDVYAVVGANDTILIASSDKGALTIGYQVYDQDKDLNNKIYNLRLQTNVPGMPKAYVTEKDHDATHAMGLDADSLNAATFKLVKFAAAKDDDKMYGDSLFVSYEREYSYVKVKDGVKSYDVKKDTVVAFTYAIYNADNKEYVAYNDKGANKFYYCDPDRKYNGTADYSAQKFVIKQKENGTYHLLPVDVDFTSADEESPVQLDTDDQTKLYGGFAEEGGKIDQREDIYETTYNDLFEIVEVGAPMYRTVEAAPFDTLRIYKEGMDNVALFAETAKPEIVSGENFLGMTHQADKDLNKTMFSLFVDTAYVNRADNYKPQYMLVLDADTVHGTYSCNIPSHGLHDNGRIDTVYGKYLINMKDSAEVWDAAKKHNNPYWWERNVYPRLAFVNAKHVGDSLIILNDNGIQSKNDTINLSDNSDKFGVYAFRIADREAKSFLIETAYNRKADGSFDATGWIKWLNGIPVVVSDIEQAEVFNFEATAKNPTANDAISTTSVSVATTDGAVIIKGAAGKTVAISNILGQTIANAVLSSDNETISAPAGVVVVAVEGEAAVKAIVK